MSFGFFSDSQDDLEEATYPPHRGIAKGTKNNMTPGSYFDIVVKKESINMDKYETLVSSTINRFVLLADRPVMLYIHLISNSSSSVPTITLRVANPVESKTQSFNWELLSTVLDRNSRQNNISGYGFMYSKDQSKFNYMTYDGMSVGYKVIGEYLNKNGRPSTLPPKTQCLEATALVNLATYKGQEVNVNSLPLGAPHDIRNRGSGNDKLHWCYYLHTIVLQKLVPSDSSGFGMSIFDNSSNLTYTTGVEVVGATGGTTVPDVYPYPSDPEVVPYALVTGTHTPIIKEPDGTWGADEIVFYNNTAPSLSTKRSNKYSVGRGAGRLFNESELFTQGVGTRTAIPVSLWGDSYDELNRLNNNIFFWRRCTVPFWSNY